jgi:signal transduction histidine kinase
MQPSAADRVILIALLAGYTVAVLAIRRWARPLAPRTRRLRSAMLIVAVGSVAVAATAVGLSASLMFISSHDLRLVLILLALSGILSTAVALAVTRPLTEDLAQLASAANRIAEGEPGTRTGVDRRDEVGRVAEAFDTMAGRLDEATAAREQMEAARRTLFTEIGHDLRTPLAALKAATEALEDGVAEDPQLYLKMMRRDLEAVGDLVDDLFLLARMESGAFEFTTDAVDLAELAEETIEGLGPIAQQRRIRLRVDTPGHVVVPGGPAQLARVIRNLVENAIQHSPPDSEVVVELLPRAEATTLRVLDRGRGFTPEQSAKAFDRFVRWAQDENRKGAGLGLAIARGIVEAHQGRIWSEPGPGGVVGFELPNVGSVRAGD